MRLLMAVAFVTLGLGCASAQPAEEIDPFTLQIEAGRWGAMMHSVAEHTREVEWTGDTVDARTIAADLRETVWEYNLHRTRLCARGFLTEATCGSPYLPAWLSESASASPSLAVLQARSDEVGAIVNPLWGAVCDHAAEGVEDPQERMYVCPME